LLPYPTRPSAFCPIAEVPCRVAEIQIKPPHQPKRGNLRAKSIAKLLDDGHGKDSLSLFYKCVYARAEDALNHSTELDAAEMKLDENPENFLLNLRYMETFDKVQDAAIVELMKEVNSYQKSSQCKIEDDRFQFKFKNNSDCLK